MATITMPGMLLTGNHAGRPAANTVGKGSLYACSTHSLVYQSDGSAWSTWLTATGASETLPATILDAKGDIIAATAADTASRLAVGADGTVLTAASGQSTGLQWATPTTAPIATISDTTRATDGTFDLTSIPGTYTHLQLVCLLRSARAGNNNDNISLRFNNDSGSNYDSQSQQGTASSNSASEAIGATSMTQLATVPAATSTANAAGIVIIEIPFYAVTTFSHNCYAYTSSTLAESTGNQRVIHGAGHWRSTAAITRITILTSNSANYLTGSRVILYGIN